MVRRPPPGRARFASVTLGLAVLLSSEPAPPLRGDEPRRAGKRDTPAEPGSSRVETARVPPAGEAEEPGAPPKRGREALEAGLERAANEAVREHIRRFSARGEVADDSEPLAPGAAREAFEVAEGLEAGLAAAEPAVRQPVGLSFDARGRLWVVQYLQYPFPAGLRVVDYDEHLRAEFDRVPDPPPHGVPGRDRVTVLEDTDGDGAFDRAKDVITGLNIATSAVVGRGGIWVLNPPYLLFYPDADRDDVPDGDPQVRLAGFGLEDTHAVANSLRWGPDGWLYGAQGSTCTAKVQGIRFLGQAVWRYRPETGEFEVFAEGGGNTFGVEIDAKGRVFSGHNGGGTRGFHYVQGGCYRKNWGKHGPLRNPYAFGWFPAMPHEGFDPRFSHCLVVYEGGAIPALEDRIVAPVPLHNRVQSSRRIPRGSSFRTEDTARLLFTEDRWFRPVAAELGPDGAVYLADWYDTRLTHVDPRDTWDRTNGRIWRLARPRQRGTGRFDLAVLSTRELAGTLDHPNRWFRRAALRVLHDRADPSAGPELLRLLRQNTGQLAIEALWGLEACGVLDRPVLAGALAHADPHVRRWAVRFTGDRKRAGADLARDLAALARREHDAEVRSQLASSAARLPASEALPVVAALLRRDADADDPHIPLLVWWALEAHAGRHDAVLELFADPEIRTGRLARGTVLERLLRRWLLEGSDASRAAATRLLATCADDEAGRRALLRGFEEALPALEPGELPRPLLDAVLAGADVLSGRSRLLLRLAVGKEDAVQRALRVVADEEAGEELRVECLRALGARGDPEAAETVVEMLARSRSRAVRRAALAALEGFDDPDLGRRVLELLETEVLGEEGVRAAAFRTLATRPAWAGALASAARKGRVDPEAVPGNVVERLRLHESPKVAGAVARVWGVERERTPGAIRREMDRVARILRPAPDAADGEGETSLAGRRAGGLRLGDPASGRELFAELCGPCHRLFGEGEDLGPDLTGYERDNLDFLLLAVLDPSAAVRGEYLSYVVVTHDGRTLTGLLTGDGEETITLRDAEGNARTVPRRDVARLQAQRTSIMPEGLLRDLDPEGVRDLFAWIIRGPEDGGDATGDGTGDPRDAGPPEARP